MSNEWLNNWIQTNSGIAFPICDPKEEYFDINDIAHCLARIPRFNGHTDWSVSVAEHSVIVSRLVDIKCDRVVMWGLLHDAAEAYICDIPSPLKRTPLMTRYRDLECEYINCIQSKFSCHVDEEEERLVKLADKASLVAEAEFCFRKQPLNNWTKAMVEECGRELVQKAKSMINHLSAENAEHAFILRYKSLEN